MEYKDLKALALHAANESAPANYGLVEVNAAVLDGFKELAGNYYEFQANKHKIFAIISEVADEVVPKRLEAGLGMFAEIKQVDQGQKAVFVTKRGKQRAKLFLTKVAYAGVYETFRLDTDSFEVNVHAVGGAGRVDFERYLSGVESIADIMEVINEGLVDIVYQEINKALIAAASSAVNTSAATNVSIQNGFVAAEMMKLINICRAYGNGVAIFATPEFVSAMGADAIVPGTAAFQGVYAPSDIEAIHQTGYPVIFRGVPIIQMQQSFLDASNTKTWLNPQYAFVLPTGAEKVAKVVFEGQTHIRQDENRDWSWEIHFYKKLGVAINAYNNWCIYQNTALTDTSA